MHDHNDDVDPELLIQFKQLWNEADELWDRERDNPSFHGYVSSDYMMAYEWLLKLRDRVCTIVEWGSGLGIVAIMASRLGYEAYGIESESELVDYSRDFAKSFGPDAQFAVGSFIPDAFQLDMAAGEEIVRTDVDAPAAYDDFDMELRDFDLIYSALAFHYIEDFAGLCRRMRARLRHAGRLVASVEHPIFSAPRRDQWLEQDEAIVWPLDSYLDEDTRVRSWFADGVIKHHLTIGTYVNTLLDSSFRLLRLVEWGPDEAQVAAHPAWARERDRPMFLLIAAQAT